MSTKSPWQLSFQRAVAEARDELAVALKPVLASSPTVEAVLHAAHGIGLNGDRYHVKVLLARCARPVEIVNAIVAHHFHISTNAAQLARRDSKSRYQDLDEFFSV